MLTRRLLGARRGPCRRMPRGSARKAGSLAELVSKAHRAVRLVRCVVDEAICFLLPPRRGPDREIETPYANRHPLQSRGRAPKSRRHDVAGAHGAVAIQPEASIPP